MPAQVERRGGDRLGNQPHRRRRPARRRPRRAAAWPAGPGPHAAGWQMVAPVTALAADAPRLGHGPVQQRAEQRLDAHLGAEQDGAVVDAAFRVAFEAFRPGAGGMHGVPADEERRRRHWRRPRTAAAARRRRGPARAGSRRGAGTRRCWTCRGRRRAPPLTPFPPVRPPIEVGRSCPVNPALRAAAGPLGRWGRPGCWPRCRRAPRRPRRTGRSAGAGSPVRWPYRNPATNASPAPLESTAGAGSAATGTCSTCQHPGRGPG